MTTRPPAVLKQGEHKIMLFSAQPSFNCNPKLEKVRPKKKNFMYRVPQSPCRLICNKTTLHNFLCQWIALQIKQDLIRIRKETSGLTYIILLQCGLKVGGQLDHLFSENTNSVFPELDFLKRSNLTEIQYSKYKNEMCLSTD